MTKKLQDCISLAREHINREHPDLSCYEIREFRVSPEFREERQRTILRPDTILPHAITEHPAEASLICPEGDRFTYNMVVLIPRDDADRIVITAIPGHVLSQRTRVSGSPGSVDNFFSRMKWLDENTPRAAIVE